eukprot:269265_1
MQFKHVSWPKFVTTSIGPRLCLKFSTRQFSFGILPIKKKSKRLFPRDVIAFIKNDFNQRNIDNIITEYSKTMTIQFLSNNFDRWQDVQHDKLFVTYLENFLMKKQVIITNAIAHKQLQHSQDIKSARNNKQQQILQHQQAHKIQQLNQVISSQKMDIEHKNKTIQSQNCIIHKQKVKFVRKGRQLKTVQDKLLRDQKFKQKNPVFLPKKQNSKLKRPKLTSKRRAQWNIQHNQDMIGNTFIWMSELSKHCSQYDELLQQQHDKIFATKTNQEFKQRRGTNTGIHFINTYDKKMSQRAKQSLRTTLTYDINVSN